ncbi:HpcH/HpaI aldolase/citrate lyase family protein [Aestuariivirga sp.]|uniref:HpcH/HpaI aldolase/citrate lyase family protein n=1 Tax=Aestuariivirga sp. TaxID=2650926 RepID=UPI0039E406EF
MTSPSFRPRRSVLYMPGGNARALEKAKTLAVDAVILDLEDSVAPDAKAEARATACAAVTAGGYGGREVVLRVNGLDTPWGKADMAAAVAARPDAILVPKVSSASDVAHAASLAHGIPLWVMIETPLSILNARDIAAAAQSSTMVCFVLGTNDLVKDTRMRTGKERLALLPALSQAVLAARAFGLDCIDGVYNDFRDEAGFAAECEQGVLLGMDGKTLIHPAQVEACNRIFSPSDAEIAAARKVIAAFALPENGSKGVITVDGRMVERLHLAMAERTDAIARAMTA